METALEHLIGVTASRELDPTQVRFEPVLPVVHLNRHRLLIGFLLRAECPVYSEHQGRSMIGTQSR
jgi:hypothetical protein